MASLEVVPSVVNYEWIQKLGEKDVHNLVESITFDNDSQTVIVQLQRSLEEDSKQINGRRNSVERADAKIKRLSETFKSKYPELVRHFKEWQACRARLVDILNDATRHVERNSFIASVFRIITSTADIVGTVVHGRELSASPLANFLMEYASMGGILALVVEIVALKKIYIDVKKAIEEDKKLFENIVQWFNQTKELDAAIRSFFPYEIDKDIVKKINASSEDFSDFNKMFMSIIASNAKQDAKLFKNEEFLYKAEQFATSDAGRVWFYKVILENDPCVLHCLNSSLCDEIQDLKRVSPRGNPEAYIDACRVLPSTIKMKVFLNLMTIISAGSKLWLEAKPEESDDFTKLSEKSSHELDEIRKIIRLLKPRDFRDPILEEMLN